MEQINREPLRFDEQYIVAVWPSRKSGNLYRRKQSLSRGAISQHRYRLQQAAASAAGRWPFVSGFLLHRRGCRRGTATGISVVDAPQWLSRSAEGTEDFLRRHAQSKPRRRDCRRHAVAGGTL